MAINFGFICSQVGVKLFLILHNFAFWQFNLDSVQICICYHNESIIMLLLLPIVFLKILF